MLTFILLCSKIAGDSVLELFLGSVSSIWALVFFLECGPYSQGVSLCLGHRFSGVSPESHQCPPRFPYSAWAGTSIRPQYSEILLCFQPLSTVLCCNSEWHDLCVRILEVEPPPTVSFYPNFSCSFSVSFSFLAFDPKSQ